LVGARPTAVSVACPPVRISTSETSRNCHTCGGELPDGPTRSCPGTPPSRPNHSLRAHTAHSVHAQGARQHLAARHGRVADTRHLRRGEHTRKNPGGLDRMRILPCNTLQHTNENQCCTRPMREMNARGGARKKNVPWRRGRNGSTSLRERARM